MTPSELADIREEVDAASQRHQDAIVQDYDLFIDVMNRARSDRDLIRTMTDDELDLLIAAGSWLQSQLLLHRVSQVETMCN